MTDTVLHGDALAVLKTLADNSVDSIVTDPPAGISFMGKDWDDFGAPRYKNDDTESRGILPGRGHCVYGRNVKKERDTFIAFLTAVMAEALRVLKPGGHALVWALPRTSHWTATALEDAGFEVRDKLYHLFGSGFPKSMDVSKAIDKMAGKLHEREVIRTDKHGTQAWWGNHPETNDITAPATPEAQQWQGYGTALKPSVEEWVLVRKPLSEASIAANVLKWGTGALAIDKCRVEGVASKPFGIRKNPPAQNAYGTYAHHNGHGHDASDFEPHPQGRFPSHLLLSHSLFCVELGVKRVRGNRGFEGHTGPKTKDIYGKFTSNGGHHTGDQDGMEEVQAWDCSPECPIAELDRQSGVRKSGGHERHNGGFKPGFVGGTIERAVNSTGYKDEGTASRYFQQFSPDVPFLYQSKASRTERNQGCEDLPSVGGNAGDVTVMGNRNPVCQSCGGSLIDRGRGVCECDTPVWKAENKSQGNGHPTVKSLALMRWLIRLITPPGGVVLDCFLGSGSTAVAAIQEGMHFIGIEQDESYVAIADARIAHAYSQVAQSVERPAVYRDVSLFKSTPGNLTQEQEYDCAEDCPIRIIGEQSGMSKNGGAVYTTDKPRANGFLKGKSSIADARFAGDTGTAARYFQQFPPDSLFAELEEVAV